MIGKRLTIIRGRTEPITVQLIDSTGEAYALKAGDVLRFGIKPKGHNSECVVVKESHITAGGVVQCTFVLEPGDTAKLRCGVYMYDVGLESGGGYYTVIPASPLRIVEEVTKIGG